MSAVLGALFSFAIFLFVLGVLVVVHEFGHYLAGRIQGFGIDAFSVGFGPKLFELKGRYNLWQFRWLLFGGYVKFRGEAGEEERPAESPLPGELFYRKPRWQRFLVMIMGVVFNALLAYLLISGLVMVGVEESLLRDQPPRVGWVAPDSPAAKAGIHPGDVLVSLDGRHVANWDQAREEIFSLTQRPYAVTYRRGDAVASVKVSPETAEMLHQPVGEIGVFPALPPVIGGVADPSPALAAGLRPGDKILSMNGQRFQYWDEFQRAMKGSTGAASTFTIERDGKAIDLTVTPQWNEKEKRFLVGITPQESTWVRYPFPSNFGKALRVTVDQSTLAYRTIKRLIEHKVAFSALSGPVSIAYITGEVARTGVYNLLWLMAIISLQLGFFNVLPIPGLDGGQILILAVESCARRDLPMIVKERILQVGFGLLIVLFAAILVMDVAKFFH